MDPRTHALLSALRALPSESAEFSLGGRTRVFRGVTLYAYAVAAGLVTGQAREEFATTYLVVTAEDGARAALSLAEVSPILSNATVLLAYEQDGEALRIGVRLMVPREGGRSLVGVVGIESHDVTDDPAPEHAVAGSLELHGLLPRPGPRDIMNFAADLVTVETATEWDREHGGVARRYGGVPVQRLLSDAGMFFMADGDALLSRVIVATGADGRRAVLAAGECGPRFTATPAIVAVQRDGVPLSAEEGPARLVVPYDHGPDRRVRSLVSLEVREG